MKFMWEDQSIKIIIDNERNFEKLLLKILVIYFQFLLLKCWVSKWRGNSGLLWFHIPISREQVLQISRFLCEFMKLCLAKQRAALKGEVYRFEVILSCQWPNVIQ